MRPNIIDMSGLCWKGWGNSTYSSRQKNVNSKESRWTRGRWKHFCFFIGFANFYYQFIQNYSSISAPLTSLWRSIKSLSWTPVPPYLPTPSLCLLLKTFPCRAELLLWANKNLLPSSLQWKRSGIGWREPPSIPGAKWPSRPWVSTWGLPIKPSMTLHSSTPSISPFHPRAKSIKADSLSHLHSPDNPQEEPESILQTIINLSLSW